MGAVILVHKPILTKVACCMDVLRVRWHELNWRRTNLAFRRRHAYFVSNTLSMILTLMQSD